MIVASGRASVNREMTTSAAIISDRSSAVTGRNRPPRRRIGKIVNGSPWTAATAIAIDVTRRTIVNARPSIAYAAAIAPRRVAAFIRATEPGCS